MFNDVTFVGVPLAAIVFPIPSHRMNLFVVFWEGFDDATSFLVDSILHCFPLFFSHFEFLDAVRIPDIAVDDNRFHRATAVGFEWTVNAIYPAGVGVEGAGATALHASLSYSY